MLFRISKLQKALRQNPGIPLFARLADEYLRRGRVARALALCQEGCERFPDYPTGFLLLARCYQARKNFEEVRNALDRALRLDPENPAAFAALSAAYERLGEISLALQCMRQAAFLEPYSRNLKREAERLRRRSAAAPLVLPPAPKAAAGTVMPAGQNEQEDHLEAGTSEREPSPAVGGVTPVDGEAAVLPARPETDRETSNGQSPPEDSGIPLDGVHASTAGAGVAAVEPESPPWQDSPAGSVYPGNGSGTEGDDSGTGGIGEVAEAEELPVPGSAGGEVTAQGEPSPSEDSPGEASGDSGPDASSPDKAEPGLRDYGQTGVLYLVSEPEEMGAGKAREAASGPDLEPEEALPVAPPVEGAAGRGSEIAPPHGTGPGRPVARLSSRDDHELTGLLSEIEIAEDRAPSPTVAQAGGEEPSAPVPTATLAELYIQQGIASKGIDIYRDLLRLHPEDDAIRGRLAVLEGSGESRAAAESLYRGENG